VIWAHGDSDGRHGFAVGGRSGVAGRVKRRGTKRVSQAGTSFCEGRRCSIQLGRQVPPTRSAVALPIGRGRTSARLHPNWSHASIASQNRNVARCRLLRTQSSRVGPWGMVQTATRNSDPQPQARFLFAIHGTRRERATKMCMSAPDSARRSQPGKLHGVASLVQAAPAGVGNTTLTQHARLMHERT
jgi:hypothetical protein